MEEIIQDPELWSYEDWYYFCQNSTLTNLTDFSNNFSWCNFTDFHPLPPWEDGDLKYVVSVVVPILFGIIFTLGLFGNALVVLVVSSDQQMRNTTNLLIINLAVADLLFIIFCVPFTATDYVLNYWPFGEAWCKIVQYLVIVTAYASVYTLVLMSLDRFLAVVYPVASISIRTEQNTMFAIGVIWVIIVVSCLPTLFSHGLFKEHHLDQVSICVFLEHRFNQTIFQICFMLTSYAIPLALICMLYFAMLFGLWKSVGMSGASRQGLRGKKRVTRLVVVVVGVFAVCWLPIQVVLVLKSLHMYEITDVTVAIQITSHVLAYMNSCVNPILYTFLSENFRKAFRKVIQFEDICGVGRSPTPTTGVTNAQHNNNAQAVRNRKARGREGDEEEEEDLEREEEMQMGRTQKADVEAAVVGMNKVTTFHDSGVYMGLEKVNSSPPRSTNGQGKTLVTQL